jgi:glycosyltransferase involved in cell wall biosynthesis
MMQLIDLFSEKDYKITFASTASASERSVDLKSLGVSVSSIQLNDESFNHFISQLKPSVVLFDRYITEEQFGWRVSEHCPDTLRILDTEDLHFLRKAREEAVKLNIPVKDANLFTDICKRELASILRCDLSLIISELEFDLLKSTFKVSSEIIHYLPFLIEKDPKKDENEVKFDKRVNFITIGNFLHNPNLDAVLLLKKEIWPLIKKELPNAQLHIYGAYAPQQILELHSEKEGFLIKGWANNVFEVMEKARVCLAPLRFGAGLKGKLIDAMRCGTPSVATGIGAEGINGDLPFAGSIVDDFIGFAKASVLLYTEEDNWSKARKNGFSIIEERFQKEIFSEAFLTRVNALQKDLQSHRNTNFLGQVLQHQSLQSTKYMSKWIEEKNKKQ